MSVGPPSGGMFGTTIADLVLFRHSGDTHVALSGPVALKIGVCMRTSASPLPSDHVLDDVTSMTKQEFVPIGVGRRGEGAEIQVVIVAPTRLYRDGVAHVLAESDSLEIAGTAHDAATGVRAIVADTPDVVLVDVALTGSLPELVAAADGAKVIAFGVPRDEDQVIACAEAGVDGYVECDATLADLERVLRGAVRNEAVCAPWMTGALLRRVAALARDREGMTAAAKRLTVREREVMSLVDEGLTNKQIAQHLRIELPTVKNHVHNVLEKLEVSGRLAAAARVCGRT